MWFYGVDAAQAAAREPAAWFALIVTIAALLTWGWCSISYTTKLEQKVNLLEERVRRYRWECERLELEKQLKMMDTILYLYHSCIDALRQGNALSSILATGIFDTVTKMKYDVPNDHLELFDTYTQKIDEAIRRGTE